MSEEFEEALQCLDLLGDFEWHTKLLKEVFPDLFEPIKQALLKSQEQKKVLEIILKKNVDILELKIFIEHHNDKVALKLYNNKVGKEWQLTVEEFNLLKRYLVCQKN